MRERAPFRHGNTAGSVSLDSFGQLPEPFRTELCDARDRGTLAYVVYSYATPIAWLDRGAWTVPGVRYSVTTTNHQSAVRMAIHWIMAAA